MNSCARKALLVIALCSTSIPAAAAGAHGTQELPTLNLKGVPSETWEKRTVPAIGRVRDISRWPDIEDQSGWPKVCHDQSGRSLGSNLKAINPLEFGGRVHMCMSSPPPQTAPFGDAEWHVLTWRLKYTIGKLREIVVVPRGFVTDFATIPRPLRGKYPKDGQYLSAAILHDYMYWDQRCTKDEADKIFLREMLDYGLDPKVAREIYTAVRLLGQSSWDANRKLRSVVPRIIPEDYLDQLLSRDSRAKDSWEQIQGRLKARGITGTPDSGNPDIGQVCGRAAAPATPG